MAEKPRTPNAGQATGSGADRDRDAATNGEQDPAAGQDPDTTVGATGRLAHDDRGNINWQWSDDQELQAEDDVGRSARIRALSPAELALEEEADLAELAQEPIPVRKVPRGGYNPYESGEPTKQSWKKKRDLRQLGKWIELKKRMKDGGG
jgi:hypothetical protein